MSGSIKGGSVGSISRLKKSIKSGGRSRTVANIPEEGLTVRFLTEPEEWFEYFEHYDDTREGSHYFPCSEGCEFCADNPNGRASKRYLVSAVDTEENTTLALKLPLSVASSLMKKYDRYKTILDRDYFLEKEGSGMDTTYDVTPEPPSKFNASKFDPIDAEAILTGMLADDGEPDDEDDEDDEDERPARKSRRGGGSSKPAAKRKRRPAPIEDDEDDDEDDEPAPRPVRRVKKRRK